MSVLFWFCWQDGDVELVYLCSFVHGCLLKFAGVNFALAMKRFCVKFALLQLTGAHCSICSVYTVNDVTRHWCVFDSYPCGYGIICTVLCDVHSRTTCRSACLYRVICRACLTVPQFLVLFGFPHVQNLFSCVAKFCEFRPN